MHRTSAPVGEAIRLARLTIHMSQAHLASASGVSERTVRRVERGEAISGESMRALCATLQIDARRRGPAPRPAGAAGIPTAGPAMAAPSHAGPGPMGRTAPTPASAPSPHPDGALALREAAGSPWPYDPGFPGGSGIEAVVGPPGTGKSTLAHGGSLALCGVRLAGEDRVPDRLPHVLALAADPWIDRLRSALPAGRRHEACEIRPGNDRARALNPFDLPLGQRRPAPLQRAVLARLLATLAGPSGALDHRPPEGLPPFDVEMGGFLVDRAYEALSDRSGKSNPKAYVGGIDAEVDDALAATGAGLPPAARWWTVVDLLHAAGDPRAAALAQRHAVPVLEDLGIVLNERSLYGMAGDAAARDEFCLRFMRRFILALRSMPLLQGPTRTPLPDGPVLSVQVGDLLVLGPGPAAWQAEISYLAAMTLACPLLEDPAHLAYGGPEGDLVPAGYRAHHAARLADLSARPRRIVLDELARFNLREDLSAFVAAARRNGVQLSLASQLPDTFEGIGLGPSDALFVTPPRSGVAVRDAGERLGLSHAMEATLRGGACAARVAGPCGMVEASLAVPPAAGPLLPAAGAAAA